MIFKNKDLEHLFQQYDWLQVMAETPQDARYHAEGDVWTHTKMVVEALLGLEEYKALTAREQELLFTATLLHDIEKPSTTEIHKDGRITSHGHARKGAQTVARMLYRDYEVPFWERLQISKLVRYHGMPVWCMEKPDPERALVKTSLETDTKLLHILAKADGLGRIAKDQKQWLEKVDFFKAYAEDLNCFGKKRHFENGQACFEYFQKEDRYLDYVPFSNFKCEVTMLCGLPGSGKDSYIQAHLKDVPMVSLDAFRRALKVSPSDTKATGRVVQAAKEQAKVHLRKGESFVWNATNISRSLRQPLIELFASYGAKVNLVYLEVPCKLLLTQNKNRTHVVPNNVMKRMIAKLEVPMEWEAHEVIYVVE